jgi:hypothetical protein
MRNLLQRGRFALETARAGEPELKECLDMPIYMVRRAGDKLIFLCICKDSVKLSGTQGVRDLLQ